MTTAPENNAADLAGKPATPAGPSISMRRFDQISAIVWLLFGAFLVLETRDLSYSSGLGPGPGFFPIWIAVVIFGLAAILLIRPSPTGPTEREPLPGRTAAVKMGLTLLGILAQAALVNRLGFIPCIFLLFLFLLVAVERRPIASSVFMSAAAAAAFWLIFVQTLRMQLPRGFLGLI